MNSNPSATYSDGFNIGEIVWARRNHDGIYWPGRITYISNGLLDVLPTNNTSQHQSGSYFIHFFGSNESSWTGDVLPYRQYRDYMSQNLLIHYDSQPQIKYQFVSAIHQADYTDINESPHTVKTNTSVSSSSFRTTQNDNYLATSDSIVAASRNPSTHTTNEFSLNYHSQSSKIYYEYAPNCPYNPHLSSNNYCSCCSQRSFPPTNQLSIETNLHNEYPNSQNNVANHQIETLSKTHSVLIITTKTYSNPSFISYLFNSLSPFFHSSIIYIDHLTNYQHPSSTYNIYYLICFDHFHSTIKQTLDSTILNNLNVHVNYLFLLINAPSHDLVKHFYWRVMDKRNVIVIHYQSTFENEGILLCSGDRRTFEMIRSTLLKYICSKTTYIETNGNEDQTHSMDNISPDSDSKNIKNELKAEVSTLDQQKCIDGNDRKRLKRKSKYRLSKDETASTTPPDYYVRNILNSASASK